jgi:8-oxo-dGTP pyrophosphatase MutT (NUDIX family)
MVARDTRARPRASYAGLVDLTAPVRRVFPELPVPVRRLAYRGAYMGLRLYWLLRRPNTSGVKCVLTDGDRILLVRHSYGPRGWDLPGGSRRQGEPPQAAARREMNEELSVQIDELASLGELIVEADHRVDHVHYYRAELRAPPIRIDEGELLTARWFRRRELPAELGRYARAIIATLPPPQDA